MTSAPKHIISGRFDPDTYSKNLELVSISSTKNHLSNTFMQVWHVPYLHDSFGSEASESGSDEEDEPIEEEKAGAQQILGGGGGEGDDGETNLQFFGSK